VVRIGQGHWLRIPLGKLRNDRYVPLHPDLVTQLAPSPIRRATPPATTTPFDGAELIDPSRRSHAVPSPALGEYPGWHRARVGRVHGRSFGGPPRQDTSRRRTRL
jgi:hypothetical protein